MKLLLSVYLSLCLAFMPLLNKASASTNNQASEMTRVQELIMSKTAEADKLLRDNGIKTLSVSGKEINLNEAIQSGDFILDMSKKATSNFRIKKESVNVEQGIITLAIAVLDLNNNIDKVTSVTINIKESPEVLIQKLEQSLQNLASNSKKDSRAIASSVNAGHFNILLGIITFSSGMILISYLQTSYLAYIQERNNLSAGKAIAISSVITISGMVTIDKGVELIQRGLNYDPPAEAK